ncbi:LysR substrate-binding domain-containing protein [Lichenihabitans psoromatis]|uniref:LysR substrate-binding domain-containing protein n=1 Tax=Lichenihabitans psoromatis TaxID=2528642 RepID=UPI0010383474|nr:LysR substrate-binding domain-containing protein [Lichenihabitans psoromatis]
MAGEDVRKQAERVEEEALTLERQVIGRDKRLAGLVRVTSSETIGSSLIAPCFGALHLQHPDTMIELLPNLRELSLSMREADIAVRIHQPEQHDLVVRRIGTVAFGLYASPDYLERHGELDFSGGLSGHHLITQLEGIQDATQTDWLAELAPRAAISLQTSSHAAAMAAALHGGGLASLTRYRADREDGLVRIEVPPLPSPIPAAALWLVVHKDNRETPRIRVALDHITKWVKNESQNLNPIYSIDQSSA